MAAPRIKSDRIVTRSDLARLHGVTKKATEQWERSGLAAVSKGRRGIESTFDLDEVARWLQARDDQQKSRGSVDLVRDRARREAAQAQLIEQTFKARSRELLPRDEVRRLWSAEVGAVRAKLLALPQMHADRVARAGTLKGVAGVEAELKAIVLDVLRDLAVPDREPHEGAA